MRRPQKQDSNLKLDIWKQKLTHALPCIGNLESKWSSQLTNQYSHPSYFPKKKILNQTYADSAYFHLPVSDVDGRGFIDMIGRNYSHVHSYI